MFTVHLIPIGVHLKLSLTSDFPDESKIANAIPLGKADDRMWFYKYHPVSLFCILSKIYEKIGVLPAYWLPWNQWNYQRKSIRIQNEMLNLHGFCCSHRWSDKVTWKWRLHDRCFLFFRGLWHSWSWYYFLKKICHYGIRDTGLKGFQSYMSERKQYVTYNDTKSSIKSIRRGVPQGSIFRYVVVLDLYQWSWECLSTYHAICFCR